jgi:hypothetical protein
MNQVQGILFYLDLGVFATMVVAFAKRWYNGAITCMVVFTILLVLVILSGTQ